MWQTILGKWAAFFVGLSIFSATAADGVPAYRIVSAKGKSSILVGSLGVPIFPVGQPTPALFKNARVLVIEHLPNDARFDVPISQESHDAAADGEYRPANWASFVTEEHIASIHRNLSCTAPAPLDVSTVETSLMFSSARVALALASYPCAPCGLKSRDEEVLTLASRLRLRYATLETHEELNAARDAVPEHVYLAMLRHVLATESNDFHRPIADALNAGDFNSVLRLTLSGLTEPGDAELYQKHYLDGRSHAWLSRLRPHLDQGGAVVVVGAAHLAGGNGLLALLQARGYTVTPKTLPAKW